MAYVPEGRNWYIAELVVEITVGGDSRNVVHRNLVLVSADSPEEAYDASVRLGRHSEASYENPVGSPVRLLFRGVSKLSVIYERLEHGAELSYEEHVDIPAEEINRWIPPKNLLGVFRSIECSPGPDYSSKEILEEASDLVKNNGLSHPLNHSN